MNKLYNNQKKSKVPYQDFSNSIILENQEKICVNRYQNKKKLK